MTFAVYNSSDTKPTTDCHFTAGISYTDKYGQTQSFNAVHWDFTNALAAKINWQIFDENKFNEIAENWSYTKGADDFNQLEEPLSNDGKYHPLHEEENTETPGPSSTTSDCSTSLYNANAVFIRATTYCRKDYMDTKGGYIALEASRVCSKSNSEQALKSEAMYAMKQLDKLVRQTGRRNACVFLDELQRSIERGKR
ncbi:protein of unknown function [Beijerinckiaceae bacterium RH AL1]|nr:hypothetical protein [Beijerinckiaceae bacterium]VVB48179.1 protein of unknown function [Beijerinckiaceae bacterium RH CH11]VVB48257.1 protein of unknown function [Beijerinckiaceae bacterium RH AL8]VVC56262.1 protein of unknown function [Beijerinckiaceae bacterium RH AL1]